MVGVWGWSVDVDANTQVPPPTMTCIGGAGVFVVLVEGLYDKPSAY